MPLIVAFAILFPVIHSYEHLHNPVSVTKNVHHENGESKFTAEHDSHKECGICHFKFTPFSTFSFPQFEFKTPYSSISVPAIFYVKTYTNFFKGSLFSLRAPPQFNLQQSVLHFSYHCYYVLLSQFHYIKNSCLQQILLKRLPVFCLKQRSILFRLHT